MEPYSGLLFWSCQVENVINVTRLNGSRVGVVAGGAGTADKPRNIALMPEIGSVRALSLVSHVFCACR